MKCRAEKESDLLAWVKGANNSKDESAVGNRSEDLLCHGE